MCAGRTYACRSRDSRKNVRSAGSSCRTGRSETMRLAQGISRGITRRRFAMLLLIAAAACARKGVDQQDMEPRPDPIPLHVKNENYLDMNVYVLVNGVQRRL